MPVAEQCCRTWKHEESLNDLPYFRARGSCFISSLVGTGLLHRSWDPPFAKEAYSLCLRCKSTGILLSTLLVGSRKEILVPIIHFEQVASTRVGADGHSKCKFIVSLSTTRLLFHFRLLSVREHPNCFLFYAVTGVHVQKSFILS